MGLNMFRKFSISGELYDSTFINPLQNLQVCSSA